MIRIILTTVLCLLFSIPAMAASSTDILLSCWLDDDKFESVLDGSIIILKPETEEATLIDPHNNVIGGGLIVAEYFYTITIAKTTQFSKVGTIKINRFTGRFSSHWQWEGQSSGGNFSKTEDRYGICVRRSTMSDRDRLF